MEFYLIIYQKYICFLSIVQIKNFYLEKLRKLVKSFQKKKKRYSRILFTVGILIKNIFISH
jgi:hypothetical protein